MSATQINLRLPDTLLSSAKSYATEFGYSNVQDFIKETIREKLYEEGEFSNEELSLIKEFKDVSDKKNLYGTEEELFMKLRQHKR